ncbi:hypothetical protein [Pedobacter sp. L105]|uniref:hypothetical protein n=1 Tax=Pedobacter sp. L105 TaxID=1641871 RepID=UPI00131BC539|nr:hypothetical protein [Pedobacter sp. L105]
METINNSYLKTLSKTVDELIKMYSSEANPIEVYRKLTDLSHWMDFVNRDFNVSDAEINLLKKESKDLQALVNYGETKYKEMQSEIKIKNERIKQLEDELANKNSEIKQVKAYVNSKDLERTYTGASGKKVLLDEPVKSDLKTIVNTYLEGQFKDDIASLNAADRLKTIEKLSAFVIPNMSSVRHEEPVKSDRQQLRELTEKYESEYSQYLTLKKSVTFSPALNKKLDELEIHCDKLSHEMFCLRQKIKLDK